MSPTKTPKNIHRDLFTGGEEPEEENGNPTITHALKKKEPPASEAHETNRFGINRASVAPETPKPEKKTYPSGPKAVFRCIPVGLKEDLDKMAESLNVPMGYLAYYLFEIGLDDYKAQQLHFQSHLTSDGYSLYPEERHRAGRPLKTSRARRDKLVGFHGVPKFVVTDIIEIAGQIMVPQGEVARRLLEYGLQRHHAGKQRLSASTIAEFVRQAKSRG